MLTTTQVAIILGVPFAEVLRLARRRRIPVHHTEGTVKKFDAAAVLAYAAAAKAAA